MRKLISYTFIFLIGVSQYTKAQVGIGTNAPNASAMLDINSTNKGMLFPSYTLTSISDPTNPVNAPADGLIIYNNGGAYSKGLYYWYVNSWNKMFVGSDLAGTMVLSTLANPNSTATLLTTSTTSTNNKIVQLGLVSTQIRNSSYNATNSEITLPKGKYKVEFSVDVNANNSIVSTGTPINPTAHRIYYVSFATYLKDTAGNILGQVTHDNEIITDTFATYYSCFYIDLPASTTFSFYLDYSSDSTKGNIKQRTSAEMQIYELKDF